MIAFVLGGGGNYGALQVGALRALLERGIHPDLVIGTSAGAINAAYFAARPTLDGVNALAELWKQVTKEDVYPGNRLMMLWRMIRGKESLFPSDRLARFIQAHIPAETSTFADLTGPHLCITATRLDTGALHLFGENPSERLVDAIMASTALPPFSPPWRTSDGTLLIDGGAVADVPVGVALEKGAKEIYALRIVGHTGLGGRLRSMAEIGHQALSAIIQHQIEHALEATARRRGVRLHLLELRSSLALSYQDFSHAAELIEEGYRITLAQLDAWGLPAEPRRPRVPGRALTWLSRQARRLERVLALVARRHESPG